MSETLRLRITEIFYSLQGEAKSVGCPTVFVRLTGCPLRCQYCDTAYAFQGGEWMTIDQIIKAVSQYNTPYVTVTGGEPLAQKNCLPLLTALCDLGYQVSLETSGAIGIENVDERVSRVVDVKTPGSGECDKNRLKNISLLNVKDQLKFVICDERDYQWSVDFLKSHTIPDGCEIFFSPSAKQLSPTMLADWILRDQLNVRFQLQLHKLLWADEPGR